jgi:hypothetical protein
MATTWFIAHLADHLAIGTIKNSTATTSSSIFIATLPTFDGFVDMITKDILSTVVTGTLQVANCLVQGLAGLCQVEQVVECRVRGNNVKDFGWEETGQQAWFINVVISSCFVARCRLL